MTAFLILLSALDFAVAEFRTIGRSPVLIIILCITSCWGTVRGYGNLIFVYDGAIMRRHACPVLSKWLAIMFVLTELAVFLQVLGAGQPTDSDLAIAAAVIVSLIPFVLKRPDQRPEAPVS